MKERIRDLSVMGSIVFFLVTVPIDIYIELTKMLYKNWVVYCLPDAYAYALNRMIWLVFPVIGIVYINMLKYDFSINQIIRRADYRKIWINLIKDTFITAFLAALYIFIWVTICGVFLADRVQCNWSDFNSNAYEVLKIQVDTFVDYRVMMFICLWVTFFMVFCVGLFIVITWWVFNTPVIGYAAVPALMMAEMSISPPPVNIFFAKILCKLKDRYLYYSGLDYFNVCIYPALIATGLIVAGFVLIRRKDFLKKQW